MPPRNSRYRVPLRRRREKKTDYRARKGFVVSGKPRLVSRSSLRNTIAQIVVAKPRGDEVMASAHSHELGKKYGWKASTGNVPAAYLTGLLCGLKAKKGGISEAILDLGLVSPTKGSKVFATMRGVVDAGIEIPHDEEKVVEKRIEGEHIREYFSSLGSPDEFAPKFSDYLSRGLTPEQITEHFVEVRGAIYEAYGMTAPKASQKPAKEKKAEAKLIKEQEKLAVKPKTKTVETKPAKTGKVVAVEKPKPKAKTEAKTEEKPTQKSSTRSKPEAKKSTPVKAKAKKVVASKKSELKPKPAKKVLDKKSAEKTGEKKA